MNELALFAGAGGGILGGHLLGWKTVAACEIEDYPRETLLRRQLDGILPKFPIWDDINTFDGTQFRGKIDIVTGGFPCQDISAAGKGAGINGERSGLWKEMLRIIGEVRPQYAFMENSPMLTSRGLGTVLGDLAEIGYDAEWLVLGADDVGAPHRRKRIWILAYSNERPGRGNGTHHQRRETSRARSESLQPENGETYSRNSKQGGFNVADSDVKRLQRADVREAQQSAQGGLPSERREITWWDKDPADVPDPRQEYGLQGNTARMEASKREWPSCPIYNKSSSKGQGSFRPTQPRLGRMAHGVANRVDRLKAIGNGQVPATMATAFLILHKRIIDGQREAKSKI